MVRHKSRAPAIFLPTFLAILVGCALPARAVIIRGDRSETTSAPSDDPGWNNVTSAGGATGVYLGSGWVIAPYHVQSLYNPSQIQFNSTTYNILSGSWRRLHDPANVNTLADLVLFKLTTTPSLPSLTISSTTPGNGQTITAIGDGKARATPPGPPIAGETWWNSSWQEQTGTAARYGFNITSTAQMRWGQNLITASSISNDDGFGITTCFKTVFDQTGGAGDYEMHATSGDSGGGVFYKRSGSWELAGLILSTDSFSGQPTAVSVHGNATYSADLSVYRSQITSIVPEPSVLWLLLGSGATAAAWCLRRLIVAFRSAKVAD